MHPNQAFRTETTEQNLALARSESFGMLAVNADRGPLVSHIPFQLSHDGSSVEAHLVRSNPIARLLADGPCPAMIAVQSDHGYISPDWYGLNDQVPTWNYVAVHLRGTLSVLPDDQLRGVLDRLSAAMERGLEPKPAWSPERVEPDTLKSMMRAIMPIRLEIESVDGTWKLNQNKPPAAIKAAADGLDAVRAVPDADPLADLMRRAADALDP